MLFLCLSLSISIIRPSDPPSAVLTLPLLLFHTSTHMQRVWARILFHTSKQMKYQVDTQWQSHAHEHTFILSTHFAQGTSAGWLWWEVNPTSGRFKVRCASGIRCALWNGKIPNSKQPSNEQIDLIRHRHAPGPFIRRRLWSYAGRSSNTDLNLWPGKLWDRSKCMSLRFITLYAFANGNLLMPCNEFNSLEIFRTVIKMNSFVFRPSRIWNISTNNYFSSQQPTLLLLLTHASSKRSLHII